VFLDSETNEDVLTAAPERTSPRGEQRPRNVLLAPDDFQAVAHSASGRAGVIRRAGGDNVLTLTAFEVDNGPDLRVYLVAGAARDESGRAAIRRPGRAQGQQGRPAVRDSARARPRPLLDRGDLVPGVLGQLRESAASLKAGAVFPDRA